MADENNTQPNNPPTPPTTETDIVESLFGEPSTTNPPTPPVPSTPPTPPTPPVPPTTPDNPPVLDPSIVEKSKEALASIGKKLTEAEQTIEQRMKTFERSQQITEYLSSEDGKIFGQYADTIKKAALDPRFMGVPLSQIPAIILKPESYSRILTDYKAAADREAASGRLGGTTFHPTGNHDEGPDFKSMSRDEFKEVARKNGAKI